MVAGQRQQVYVVWEQQTYDVSLEDVREEGEERELQGSRAAPWPSPRVFVLCCLPC